MGGTHRFFGAMKEPIFLKANTRAIYGGRVYDTICRFVYSIQLYLDICSIQRLGRQDSHNGSSAMVAVSL